MASHEIGTEDGGVGGEDALTESRQLATQLEMLSTEMSNMKAAVAVSEGDKVDQIESIERKCQQQLMSMQQIMKDAVFEAKASAVEEKTRWMHEQLQPPAELAQRRLRLSPERDGFLSTVTKTLQKKVAAVGTLEADNLEESMKKAQEDTAILKSVVLPLEEEIFGLKAKLRQAYTHIISMQHKEGGGVTVDSKPVGNDSAFSIKSVEALNEMLDASVDGNETTPVSSLHTDKQAVELDEKVKELHQSLETEKSSRTDLEMYVAVLNTQKTVLQDDSDRLRAELQDVCRLLELEKREHNDLKQTWLMANDQFLGSQRLMMADLLQLRSVLTEQQQAHLAELKKKTDQTANDVEQGKQQEHQQMSVGSESDAKPQTSIDLLTGVLNVSRTSLGSVTSVTSDDLTAGSEEGASAGRLPRTHSSQSLQLSSAAAARDAVEVADTRSLQDEAASLDSASSHRVPPLSEAMQRAITDPTPEVRASESLVATARRHVPEVFSMVGRRLVSEKEWLHLQSEVKRVADSVGRPCDLCDGLRARLEEGRERERRLGGQVSTLERQLQAERAALAAQLRQLDEVEATLAEITAAETQHISTLASKLIDAEKYTQETKKQFIQSQAELHSLLKTLTEGREEIHRELSQLQEANETLVGKQLKHSQLLQEENISLPNSIEEVQLLLLRCREDLISAAVAKEYSEERLVAETLFLKAQVTAEMQEKATLEETLNQEISTLQEALAIQRSVKSELDRQSSLRCETEGRLRETEATLKSIQAKSKQLIHALQNQLEQQTTARTKLESEVDQLKMKLQTIQVDFDNSEAVQQDFVKLSQSLQIQLEKIRAAEHEVRWQHEEDVDECGHCGQFFSVTKRKHHCKHCGRIFCADCISKTVSSGPNLRSSKVCSVCHTILVQDAAPYFSTDIPKAP